MKHFTLIALTVLSLSSPALASSPHPTELNMVPAAFDLAAVRTIKSIACEGASNGLPRADIQRMVKLILPPNAKRRYTFKELNSQIDQIVVYAMPCRVR